jgi:hypothetical protein
VDRTDATATPDAAEAATDRLASMENVTERDGETGKPGTVAVPSVPEPRPPGIGPGGVANVSALADAHTATLDGRSYRLTVRHREFVDGTATGVVTERTVVGNATRYRSDLQWAGAIRREPRALGNASAFADGRTRYVRFGGEAGATIETPLRPTDRVATRSGRYLRSVLTGSDTRLLGVAEHGETTRIWIAVGRDEGTEPATTGSILVGENGLVRELHHEYVYRPSDGPSVRVVVTMRIDPGNVSASPPPWVVESQ